MSLQTHISFEHTHRGEVMGNNIDLISPYGGDLINLIESEETADELIDLLKIFHPPIGVAEKDEY